MSRRRILLASVAAGFIAFAAAPAYAYWTAGADPEATLAAATLGTPTATFTSTTSSITVQVAAPATGPAPTGYTVSRDGTVVCTLTSPGACPADTIPTGPATSVSYTVTAALGTAWRASITLAAATQPPAPLSVQLPGGSDTGLRGDGITSRTTPTFAIRAPKAHAQYSVTLVSDGSALATANVPAGTGTASVTLGTGGKAFTPSTSASHLIQVRSVYQGQQSAPVAMTPVDHLQVWGPPSVTGVALGNVDSGTAGVAETGDTVTITFSQPLNPATVCANWSVTPGDENITGEATATLTNNTTDSAQDTLQVSVPPDICDAGTANVLNLGTVDLAGDYVSGGTDNGQANAVSFAGSTLDLSSDWTTLTITLGSPDSGSQYLQTAPASTGAARFTPASGNPQDQAGNPFPAGTSPAGTPTRF